MSSKTYLKLLAASFIVGIGMSFVGCGESGGGGAVPPVGASVSPQALNGLTPNNCYLGGRRERAADGAEICRVTIVPEMNNRFPFTSPMARLTPSSSDRSIFSLIHVQQNDSLVVTDLDGGWGGIGHCKDIKTDGFNSVTRTMVYNENRPSGLYVSSGGGIFSVVKGSVIAFDRAGRLRLGFNAPASSGDCHSFSIAFRVDRCLDVASMPHKCK